MTEIYEIDTPAGRVLDASQSAAEAAGDASGDADGGEG